MAKTIVLDGVELTQLILMKDKASGKVLVRATYQVKSGNEVVKTTADRMLTVAARTGETPLADLLNAQEATASAAAWTAVQAALERVELA